MNNIINNPKVKANNNTESKKIESTRETITNTETSKLESKKDSKNKNEVRLGSNGDEIMYETKHNLSWWDYIMYSIVFFLGITMMYNGIEAFLFNKIEYSLFITLLVFGIPATLIGFHCLFYAHKNRFYIAHQGIGFERRKWFRMQKRFFKFGKVGAIEKSNSLGLFPAKALSLISIFPLGAIKSKLFFIGQLKPYCTIVLVAWNIYLSPKLYDEITGRCYLHEFLVKKTKEALESQGIDTKILPYDLDKQFDI